MTSHSALMLLRTPQVQPFPMCDVECNNSELQPHVRYSGFGNNSEFQPHVCLTQAPSRLSATATRGPDSSAQAKSHKFLPHEGMMHASPAPATEQRRADGLTRLHDHGSGSAPRALLAYLKHRRTGAGILVNDFTSQGGVTRCMRPGWHGDMHVRATPHHCLDTGHSHLTVNHS